jgi:hypothetical protein
VERVQPKTPRDLATICMKCLDKDPRNRYGTAAALADDLHRFLTGDSIRARPTTSVERLWKWARRRPGIAVLSACLLVVMLLGCGAATWGWWHAAATRDEMERKELDALRARDEARDIQAREAAARERLEVEVAASRTASAAMLYRLGKRGEAEALLNQCPTERRDWSWRLVKRWLQPGAEPCTTVARADAPIVALAMTPAAGQVVYLTRGGRLGAGSPMARSESGALPLSGDGIAPLAAAVFAEDGHCFVTASENGPGRIQVWEGLADPKVEATVAVPSAKLIRVAMSAWGQRLAILHEGPAEKGRQINVWDERQGAVIAQFASAATVLAVSADGARIATGEAAVSSSAAFVALRDAATGRQQAALEWPGRLEAAAADIAFSADGKYLAAASGAGHLAIWETASGKSLHSRPLACIADARALAFSPDGRLLAVAARNQVEIWNVAIGQKVLTLDAGPAEATSAVSEPHLAWSRDGKCLAAAGPGNSIVMWSGAE